VKYQDDADPSGTWDNLCAALPHLLDPLCCQLDISQACFVLFICALLLHAAAGLLSSLQACKRSAVIPG
jgi:hypothetical protein